MANWEDYTVEEAVRKIDSHEWQLPVIQRDFVWPKTKIELLFDTLLKKEPFGGIMSYVEECGNKPLFAHRVFSLNGETNKSINDNDKLYKDRVVIIDGQQRLQSMYIALKGNLYGEILYFDVLNLPDCEEYYFIFSNNFEKLPQVISADDGTKRKCKWISLHALSEEYQKRRDSERLSKRVF